MGRKRKENKPAYKIACQTSGPMLRKSGKILWSRCVYHHLDLEQVANIILLKEYKLLATCSSEEDFKKTLDSVVTSKQYIKETIDFVMYFEGQDTFENMFSAAYEEEEKEVYLERIKIVKAKIIEIVPEFKEEIKE